MKKILLALALLLPVTAYADEIRQVGSTSQMVDFFVSDSSSTTGAGLGGPLTSGSGQSCYYHRSSANASVQIPLYAGTLGTWSNSTTNYGWIAVDNTNMPGWYQLSLPDAALASGATYVTIQCKGATNMAPMNLRIVLTQDPSTAVMNGTKAELSSVLGTGTLAYGDMIRALYQRFFHKNSDDRNTSEIVLYKADGSTKLCESPRADAGSVYTVDACAAAD